MATDRDEMEYPCPCGKGKIEVVHESPDHGWSSGQWSRWSASLDCQDCSEIYAFDDMKLAAKADVERIRAARADLQRAEAEARDAPGIGPIRSALARHLDGMRSNAARHRWLEEVGLEHGTYATFSKHYRSGAQYAERVANLDNFLTAADVLHVPCDDVRAAKSEIERLKGAAWEDIPAVKTGIVHLVA